MILKVNFRWNRPSLNGGLGDWEEKFVLIDGETAEELNKKIDDYIQTNSSEYQKNMFAQSIEKL